MLFDNPETTDFSPPEQGARLAAANLLSQQALRQFDSLDQSKDGRIDLTELERARGNETMPEATLEAARFLGNNYSRFSDYPNVVYGHESRGYSRDDILTIHSISSAADRNGYSMPTKDYYSQSSIGGLVIAGVGALTVAAGIYTGRPYQGLALGGALMFAGGLTHLSSSSKYEFMSDMESRIRNDQRLDLAIKKFGL